MSDIENEGHRLVAALLAAGFHVAGRGRGYTRVGRPGEGPERGSLVVPTDDTAPEFTEALEQAKAALLAEARRGEQARYALDLHLLEAGR